MAEAIISPRTLARNLVVFGRVLRASGIAVDPGQIADLQRALTLIDVSRPGEVHSAARAVFVRRVEDLAIFDRVFGEFWRVVGRLEGTADTSRSAARPSERVQDTPRPEARAELGRSPEASLTLLSSDPRELLAGDEELADAKEAPIPIRTYSAREVLRTKDFGTLTPAELAAAREMLQRLRWQIGARRSRRTRPTARGDSLDLRTTLRKSLQTSGEVAKLSWRMPRTQPHPVVILGDVSGSMDRYTRLLVQFFYAFRRGRRDVEVFVFGTQLTRITHELDHHRVDEALRQVADRVRDWSGGTRIGEALGTFNRLWARRILGRSVITVIVSDGWDRGDSRDLAREIEQLQRRSYRLVWLNPLLGLADYRPLTTGMEAALPYVDDFLPAHNLASLADLASRLTELESRRPIRRQRIVRLGAPV